MTDSPSIFAIDPGISTGWAFLASYDVAVGTIIAKDVDRRLARLMDIYGPEEIIVERMPQRIKQDVAQIIAYCQIAVQKFKESYPSTKLGEVSPGEWKPITNKIPLPVEAKTQHEKDAYRMARYWLFKQHGVHFNDVA